MHFADYAWIVLISHGFPPISQELHINCANFAWNAPIVNCINFACIACIAWITPIVNYSNFALITLRKYYVDFAWIYPISPITNELDWFRMNTHELRDCKLRQFYASITRWFCMDCCNCEFRQFRMGLYRLWTSPISHRVLQVGMDYTDCELHKLRINYTKFACISPITQGVMLISHFACALILHEITVSCMDFTDYEWIGLISHALR